MRDWSLPPVLGNVNFNLSGFTIAGMYVLCVCFGL
jgi:hypothetical protein